MSVFLIFQIFLHFLSGLVIFFTGFFLWRKLRDDFEARTIGGILILTSLLFLLMGLRNLFWGLGWISESLTFNIFFTEYMIIFFLLLPFALPRFLYLVFTRPIVKTVGLILGGILYLAYLAIHFSQREKIIGHYAPESVLFEPPSLEKVFLAGIFILLIPMMLYRANIHFLQWRKTKTFPYRFLNYLLMLFIFFISIFTFFPQLSSWGGLFAYILILGGFLGIYLISSQETIKGQEFIPVPEKEEKKRADKLERLYKLTEEIDLKIEDLKKELEEK